MTCGFCQSSDWFQMDKTWPSRYFVIHIYVGVCVHVYDPRMECVMSSNNCHDSVLGMNCYFTYINITDVSCYLFTYMFNNSIWWRDRCYSKNVRRRRLSLHAPLAVWVNNDLSLIRQAYLPGAKKFDFLWLSDAIERRGSGSTLDRLMACFLSPPGLYLWGSVTFARAVSHLKVIMVIRK